MDLSIVIVSWNTRDDLARALTSMAGANCPVETETIVVDNASTDGSAAMVEQKFPWAQVISNGRNLGFAAANNQGLRASRGEFVLLLNPDTVVHPCALSSLVEFMRAHSDAAACGPKLLNADGSLQFSSRRFPTLATGFFRKVPLGRLLPDNRFNREYLMSDWDHTQPRQVDWVSGAALCLRRRVTEEIGLLDEGYFMYCEDVDWCYRARQAGYAIYYVPQATITHTRGRSSIQRPRRMALAFHQSMLRFYRKHYARGWPVWLRWFPAVGIAARLLVVLVEIQVSRWRNAVSRWLGRL